MLTRVLQAGRSTVAIAAAALLSGALLLQGCAGDAPDWVTKTKAFVVKVVETTFVKDKITAAEAAVLSSRGAVVEDRILRASIVDKLKGLLPGDLQQYADEAIDAVDQVCVKKDPAGNKGLSADEAAALNAARAADTTQGRPINAAAGDILWAGNCSDLILLGIGGKD
jgi:hypothetical protein